MNKHSERVLPAHRVLDIEHLRGDDSSLSFKRCLLENLNNEMVLDLLLMEEKVGDDIVFWQHDETRYLILGSDDKLDHPGTVKHWEETDYFQVEHKDQRFSSELPKQPFTSEAEVKGDFFLPLGWLVESNKEGTKRATRYVCMLNISTDPLSLWLMFDYLIKGNKGQTIKIRDLTYIYDDDIYGPNPSFCDITNAKNTIGRYDLLLVHKNVADWDPSGKDTETTTNSSLLQNPSLSFHLGSSIQAIGVVPPKSLLNHLTKPFHDPKLQPCYTFIDGAWKENGHPSPTPDRLPNDVKIKLVTWNIDYIAVAGPQRMAAALQYLQDTLITGFSSANIPTIICLQEMTSSDLDIMKSTSWIQSRFSITDISCEHRLFSYGTTTLIDLRLPLRTVFRTRYVSDNGRDALFVDLDFSDDNRSARDSRLRLGNTHLESRVADPPLRPAQLALASRLMHDDSVHGGVLVGDFNSIQRFDKTLHVENDLKDAYLEAGGIEGDEKEGEGPGWEKDKGGPGCEKGWTWGMQSHGENRDRFGCSRLDKMVFCGGVRLEYLERVGEGVKVPEGQVGEGMFVTDHLGLMADLIID